MGFGGRTEVGYDLTVVGNLVLRPKLGAGVAVLNYETCNPLFRDDPNNALILAAGIGF